ncbi:MAG: response regulator, partial [Nitrospirae bacterium]|nr:response regulator [Nitrospirota bacterium]
DYLLKPIEPTILRSKIRVFCELYRQRRMIEMHEQQLETLVNERTAELRQANEQLQSDIAERKIAEQALERTVREWNAAMDASADVIYILDLNRCLMRANRAFYEMTGSTPEDAIGCHIAHLLHPDTESRSCPVCRAQEENRDILIALEADHPANLMRRPVEISSRFVRDRQEIPVSFMVSMHDLTHERGAQEERSKLEAQLLHAQKMESIGQLAGGVAHDFNNMLTAVIGYATLINLHATQDPVIKTYAEQILEVSDKAANLTQKLLAFSRKQTIDLKPTDLNAVVRNMEKFLRRLIGEDLELRIRLTEAELTVMADAGQLEQVIMNLCTNARDAMPKCGLLTVETGAVTIDETYLSTHLFEKPGPYALITVSDTGAGMDETTRERIFEPFFTTKDKSKGTGLGLSIVYGIVRQHKGEIHVYSEPGKGTTFRIYLPLIEGKEKLSIQKTEESHTGGTETILLAEDEEDVRRLIRTVLTLAGYTIIEAVDGVDAVTKYRENREAIQLILTDLVMPKKSGRDAYDEIRRLNPAAKFLFMSGYTSDVIQEKKLLESGIPLISKPVSPGELLRRLREELDT